MRITSVGSVSQYFADRYSYAGVSTPYLDTVKGITISTLKRSDIVKNPDNGAGWRRPSPYDVILTASEPGRCEIWMDNPNNKRYLRNMGGCNPNAESTAFNITEKYLDSVLPKQGDIDIAVIKARNNVADRVASFGESLAELMKTLSGLGSLASQINEFLIAVSKKDYPKVADSLGIPRRSRKHRRAVIRYNKLGIPTVSNAFLCWNFGLKPIISDMVSLAILMGQGKPLRVVGKGMYARESGNYQNLHPTPCMVSYVGSAYTVYQFQVHRSGTYVRLDYEMSFERLRDLASYGLLDAPATLWAIMPYSFLVDFVLPVSEVLRSLMATFGLDFKGGSATRFVTVDRKYAYSTPPKDTSSLKVHKFVVKVDKMKGLRMKRTVFITDPNPVTLWLKDPLSAFSVATVFSLLGQKLGKGRFT